MRDAVRINNGGDVKHLTTASESHDPISEAPIDNAPPALPPSRLKTISMDMHIPSP
jgi:hypothetical protein